MAGGGYDYVTTAEVPATLGVLTSPLYAGPVDRWDMGNTVSLRLFGGAQLLSLTEAQVLGGAGSLAVKNPATGDWEVLQYQNATLVAVGAYNLQKLLRGQLGTEGAMANPAPTGARIVVLDTNTLLPLDMTLDQRGLAQVLRYGPSLLAPSDATYTQVVAVFPGHRSAALLRIADLRFPHAAGRGCHVHLDAAHALCRR